MMTANRFYVVEPTELNVVLFELRHSHIKVKSSYPHAMAHWHNRKLGTRGEAYTSTWICILHKLWVDRGASMAYGYAQNAKLSPPRPIIAFSQRQALFAGEYEPWPQVAQQAWEGMETNCHLDT